MQSTTSKDNFPRYWIGLDIAKASFDAAVVETGRRYEGAAITAIKVKRFSRTPQGIADLVQWLRSRGVERGEGRCCMEATGSYSEQAALWLTQAERSLAPAIVNARQTAHFIKSLGLRNKTDRLEARALALYGAQRQPAAFEPLSPELRDLRDLSRCRDSLVSERAAIRNWLGSQQHCKEVVSLQQQRLCELDRHIAALERRMRHFVAQHSALAHDVALLSTVRGVDFLTAVTVLTELGDLRRFSRARQLSAFCGMSPRLFESGSSVRGGTHLCKQGNQRVRQALYLSAMAAIRYKGAGALRALYEYFCARGKTPMQALAIVMRKLLLIMRAVLLSGESYDPCYQQCA